MIMPTAQSTLSLCSACGQARPALHAAAVRRTHTGLGHRLVGLNGPATPFAPQGLRGSTPWGSSYMVARSKRGIPASSSLTCSEMALSELPLVNCLQTTSGFQSCYSPKHLASRHYLFSDLSAFSLALGLQAFKASAKLPSFGGYSDVT